MSTEELDILEEGFGRRAWNKGRKMSHLWKEWLHPRDRRGRFIDVPNKIAKGMLKLRDGEFYDLSTLIGELNKAREGASDSRRVTSARIWRSKDENGNALWELRWTDQDGTSRGKKIRAEDFVDDRGQFSADRLLDQIANELEDIVPEWEGKAMCACGCGNPLNFIGPHVDGDVPSRRQGGYIRGHELRGKVPRGVVDPNYSLNKRKTYNAKEGRKEREQLDPQIEEARNKLRDAEAKINETRRALKEDGLDDDRKSQLKDDLKAAKKSRREASAEIVELAKKQRKAEKRYGRIWTGEDEEWAQGMSWWERIEQRLRGFENDGTPIPKEDRADVLRQEMREWRQAFAPTKPKNYKIQDDEYKIARSMFTEWAAGMLEDKKDPFDPRIQRQYGAPLVPKSHRNWEARDFYNDKFVKPPPAVLAEARARQARTGRRQFIYVDPGKLSRVGKADNGEWLYEFEDEDTYIIDDALHVSNDSSDEWIRVNVDGQEVERPNLNGKDKHLLLRGFIGEEGRQYALNGMQELRERDILDRDSESLDNVLDGTDSSVYERLTYLRFVYGNPHVDEMDEEISQKYGFRIRGARDQSRKAFGDGASGEGDDAKNTREQRKLQREEEKRQEFFDKHGIYPDGPDGAEELKLIKERRAKQFRDAAAMADGDPATYSDEKVGVLVSWWTNANRYWTDDNQKDGGRLLPVDLAADLTKQLDSAYVDIDKNESPGDFDAVASKLSPTTSYKRIKVSGIGAHYAIAQRSRDGVFEIWKRGNGDRYTKVDESGTIQYAQQKVALLEHKRQFDRLRKEVDDAIKALGRNQDPADASRVRRRLDNLDKVLKAQILKDAQRRQNRTNFGGDGPADGPISPPDGGGGPRPNPGGSRGGGGALRPGTLNGDEPRTMDSEDFEPTRIKGDSPPGAKPGTQDFIGPMPDPDEAKKENPAPAIDPDKEEILKIHAEGEGDDKIEAVFFYTLEEQEIEIEGGGRKRIPGLGPAEFVLWRRDGDDNTAEELMRTPLGKNARDNEHEFEKALGPVRDYASTIVDHEIDRIRRERNGDDPDPYVDPDTPENKARIERLADSVSMGSEEKQQVSQEIREAIVERNESKAQSEVDDLVQSIINEPEQVDIPEREVDKWDFEQDFEKEPNRFGIREGVGFWLSPDGETSYRLDWNDNKNKGALFYVDADGNDHVVADEVGINMHDRDVQISDIVDQDIRGVYERAPDRKRREANDRVNPPEVDEPEAPRQRRAPQQMAHFRDVARGKMNGNMDLSGVEGDNAPEFIGAQMNEFDSDQVDVAHFRVLTRKEDGTVVQQVITHDFVKGETKVHPVEEIDPEKALNLPDIDNYSPPKDKPSAGVWRVSDVDQMEMYDPAGRHFVMKYSLAKDKDGVDVVVGEVWESIPEGPDRLRFKRQVVDKGEYDRERAHAELKDGLQDDLAIQNVKDRMNLIDPDELEPGTHQKSPHGGGDLVRKGADGKISYLMFEGSDGEGTYFYTRAESDGDSYKLYRTKWSEDGSVSREDFLRQQFGAETDKTPEVSKPHDRKPKTSAIKLGRNVEKIENVSPHEAVRQVIHAINSLERYKADNGKEYLLLPDGAAVFSVEVDVDKQGRPVTIIRASDDLFGHRRDVYKLHDGDGMYPHFVKDPTYTDSLRPERTPVWHQTMGQDPVWHDPDVEDMFKGARQERLANAEDGLRAAKDARPSTKAKEEFKSVAKRWDPTEDGWREITPNNYKKGDFLLQKKGPNWVVTRAGEKDPVAGGPKPEVAIERAREKVDLDATPDGAPVATAQNDDDMDMPEGWNPDTEEDVLPDVDEAEVDEIDGYPEVGEILDDPATHPNLGHVAAWEAVRDAALHGVRPKGHAEAEDFYVWYDARENIGEGRGLPVGWRSGPVAPDADGVMVIAQVPPYDRKRGAEVIGFPKFFGRANDKDGPWFDDMPDAMIDPEGNPEIKMRRADLKSGESGRDLDSVSGDVPDGDRKDWDNQVDMYRRAHDETIDKVEADTPDKPLPARAERLNSKSPGGMFQDGRDQEWDEWDPTTSDAPKMDFPGIDRYDVKYDEMTGLHHVNIVGADGKVHKYRLTHKPSASWMQRKMDYHGLGLDEAAHDIDDILDPDGDPDFGRAAHIDRLIEERGTPIADPNGTTIVIDLGKDRDAAIAMLENDEWKWDDDSKQLVMRGEAADRFQEYGEDLFHGLADEAGFDIADIPEFDGEFKIVDTRIARRLFQAPSGEWMIVVPASNPRQEAVGQAGMASLTTGRVGIHFDMQAFKAQYGNFDGDPIEAMSHIVMHESGHILSLKESDNWRKVKQSPELGSEEGLVEALSAINLNRLGRRFGFASKLSPDSSESRLFKMMGGEGDVPRRSVYSLHMSVYEFWRDDLKMNPRDFYGRLARVPFNERRQALKDMVDPKDHDLVDKMWGAQSEDWFRATWPHYGDGFSKVNAWDAEGGKWKSPAEFYGSLDRLVERQDFPGPRFGIDPGDSRAARRVGRAKFNTTDMAARDVSTDGGPDAGSRFSILESTPEKVQLWRDVKPDDWADDEVTAFGVVDDDQLPEVERRLREGGLDNPREFIKKFLSFEQADEADRQWLRENLVDGAQVTVFPEIRGETQFSLTVDITGQDVGSGWPSGLKYRYSIVGERNGRNSYRLHSADGYVSYFKDSGPDAERPRPKGIGTRMQIARMKFFRDNGIKVFRTETGLRIGGYIWAKMGFRMNQRRGERGDGGWESRQNRLVRDIIRQDAGVGVSGVVNDRDRSEEIYHPYDPEWDELTSAQQGKMEALDWINLDDPREWTPADETDWVKKNWWGVHSADAFRSHVRKLPYEDQDRARVMYKLWRGEIRADIEHMLANDNVNGIANYKKPMPEELYEMIKAVSPDVMGRDQDVSIEEMRKGIRNPFTYVGRDTLLGAGADGSLVYEVEFDWDNPVDVSRLIKYAESQGIDASDLL